MSEHLARMTRLGNCESWTGSTILEVLGGRGGWLRRRQRRRMVLHLLTGCPSCAAKVKKMTRPAPLIEVRKPAEDSVDEKLFERALVRLSEMQRPAQELFINGVAGLRAPAFVGWLADKCRRAVVWDPEEAVRLGRLGVLASEGLDVNTRALAGMRMGQALRRARGDYLGADTWFEKSRELLQEESADPLLLAKLLRLQGYSRFVQSRSAEALPLFAQAAEIYREAQDLEGFGKTLADQAAAVEEIEGSEAAIRCLLRACCYIDFVESPRFALMIAQSLSLYHANLGNTDTAVSYLEVARRLLEEQGSAPADALRMDWSAGRILAQAGRASESVIVLSKAKDGFVGLGLAAEAGQISLDLALSLLALDRTAELKELAQEMLPIFRSRLLHKEALAALEFFRTAVVTETITAAQIHAVAEFLAELECNGKARFRRPT